MYLAFANAFCLLGLAAMLGAVLRCPACGHPLGISLTLETDYSKTKRMLDQKAGPDPTNEQLADLKWRQSQKRETLGSLLVTATLLETPAARSLYERLKASPNLVWKCGGTTYKLWRTGDGAELLQRWVPLEGVSE